MIFQDTQNGNEGGNEPLGLSGENRLRFHFKHLVVYNGNEAFRPETGMETKARKWKRNGNEREFLETGWKRLLTPDGNEGLKNTPLRFHALSLVSIRNPLGTGMETKP